MGTINADWHKANKMPKNPTQEQRLEWPAAHMKHCACRAPGDKLLQELKKRKLVS